MSVDRLSSGRGRPSSSSQDEKEGVLRIQQAALAKGTWRHLTAHWVCYLEFCSNRNIRGVPADADTLCRFLYSLVKRGLRVGTVDNYRSSIKTLHAMLDLPTDEFKDVRVKLFFRGLRKLDTRPVRQAPPLTPEHLFALAKVVNHEDETEQLVWATILVSFFLLFRSSNLLPKQHGEVDRKVLLVRDVKFEDGQLWLTQRFSKTHQFGSTVNEFPLPAFPMSGFCPVEAVYPLLCRPPDQPLISYKSGRFLLYARFVGKFRTLLSRAGVPRSATFTSHSLRRGGTTWAFLAGVPPGIIKVLGGWRSDTYTRYLEFPREARSVACELMKIQMKRSLCNFRPGPVRTSGD